MALEQSNYKSFKEYPGPIKRQGPFNIDTTAMYTSAEEALNYAKTNPAAYDGQILTVCEKQSDGSTKLSYFGIKNYAKTTTDGTITVEPQLVEIPTADSIQDAISAVSAVKYKGTIAATLEGDSTEPTISHFTFDQLMASYSITDSKAGDMYNVYFTNSTSEMTDAAHVYTLLPVSDGGITDESDENYWTPTGDQARIGEFYEETDDNGDAHYGIRLDIGQRIHGILPPVLPSCSHVIAYPASKDASNTAANVIFFKAWEIGVNVTENLEIYPYIKIDFVDPTPEIANLDNWAASHIPMPEGCTSANSLDAKASTAWTKFKSFYEKGDKGYVFPLLFATLLRNGDNIVYNGYFWDVMSGMVDLTAYATKEDISDAISSAENHIYRED